jgi:hypothetical protein
MPRNIAQKTEIFNRNKHSVKAKLNLKNTKIGEHYLEVMDKNLDHLTKSELISLVKSQSIFIARLNRELGASEGFSKMWRKSEQEVRELKKERLELLENFYSFITKGDDYA